MASSRHRSTVSLIELLTVLIIAGVLTVIVTGVGSSFGWW